MSETILVVEKQGGVLVLQDAPVLVRLQDGSIATTAIFQGSGTSGLVPDPGAGTDTRVLRADGSWSEETGGVGQAPADAQYLVAASNGSLSAERVLQAEGGLEVDFATPGAAKVRLPDGAVTDAKVAAANKDGLAGVASMRTLGSGALQAAAGNDPRLSDQRVPLAHFHDGSDITSGTVDAARLGSGSGGATKFLREDSTWQPVPDGALTLSGDVTGTGTGSVVTTIAALAVTDAKVAAANKDGLAAVASMRTLGSGALQACSGSDPRLSDQRVPLAHFHDGSDITTGTVDAARLGSGSGGATKFLREDSTWQNVPDDSLTLSGDVTGTGTGSVVTTIAPLSVTDAKVAAANKDGLSGVASMRTLGSGALQACSGSDPRLSDARTPLAHFHDASEITSGTLDSARLSRVIHLTEHILVGEGVEILEGPEAGYPVIRPKSNAGTIDPINLALFGINGGRVTADGQLILHESEFTAKGQILVGTGIGTFVALPIGVDGTTLTADSLAASGMKWSASYAPKSSEYLVAALDPDLGNERLLQGEDGVTVDFATPGAAKVKSAYPIATQLEAEAGTGTSVLRWTPQRITQLVESAEVPKLSQAVAQTGHGFAVGTLIRSSGTAGAYARAQADTETNAEVLGFVTEVVDANNFVFSFLAGITLTGVPAYAAGTVVWLSPTVAGGMTSTRPSTEGQVAKPIGVVITNGAAMVLLSIVGVLLTATPVTDVAHGGTGATDAATARTNLGAANVAGTLGQFGMTTSAQLLGVMSDATGTGELMFGTSPRITTSILDANGVTMIAFTATPGADSWITFQNQSSSGNPRIGVGGGGTSTGLTLLVGTSGNLLIKRGATAATAIVDVSTAQTLALKTLTAPIIADFSSAPHTHTDAAGGGTLDASAIAAGTVATARLGSGTADGTTFLRGDQTWAVPSGGSGLTQPETMARQSFGGF